MKSFSRLLILLPLMGFVTGVSAIPITTVGSVDTFLDSTALPNSSEVTEETWIESVLGFDIEYNQLADSVSEGNNWVKVQDTSGNDISDRYAFQFDAGVEPGYFLVKTRNLQNNAPSDHRWFLFENLANLDWAHLDLMLTPDITITNIGKVSHVGEASGSSVPEPNTVALLGLGMILVSVLRLKQHKLSV